MVSPEGTKVIYLFILRILFSVRKLGGIEESFSVQTGFHYVLFLECTNGISGKLMKKFECKQAHGDKSCFITILLLVSLDQLLFIRREELRNLQTDGRIIFVSVPFNEDIKFC